MADVASFVDPRLVKRLQALVPTSCCGSTPPEPQFGHTGQLTHIFCAICTTYFTTVTTFELTPNFGRGQRSITADGQTRTISEWCAKTGIPEHLVHRRIWEGWPLQRAVQEPHGAYFKNTP